MSEPRRLLRPWHFVLAFGIVSLLADMVYEGARSIIGPYLSTLGASATIVGVVAGAGEFIGYGLRVVTGYAVARHRHYWSWTITGYALTVLSVPLIGVTGAVAPALVLYATERLGKAVRSPAKDTLLAAAASRTGRGSAFGVHQALDQAGAMLGPLLLAAVLGWRDGDYALAFGVLIVPGVAVLAVLFWLRRRVPNPNVYEQDTVIEADRSGARRTLSGRYWLFVSAVAVLSVGVPSFPLIAFHAQRVVGLSDPVIPLLFAVAMAVDGLAGLVMGRAYDRLGPRTLLVVPLAAAASALAFTSSTAALWAAVAIWGVVNGVLDSTVKAVVAGLVPAESRAVAFGWLALVRGGGLLIAGAALGAAYDGAPVLLITLVLTANALGLILLGVILRQAAR